MVLPAVGGGRLRDAGLKRWLARAPMQRASGPNALLADILAALGMPCPRQGLGALRMWGQTGDRPAVWIAAADPVYLEPQLDHLRLYELRRTGIEAAELRTLYDYLQDTLAERSGFGFARLGTYGYLRAEHAIATAEYPADALDRRVPNEFMPAGDGAEGFRQLVSEIEMALHEHEINVERQMRRLPPVNSLWLWGGGLAPEQVAVPHPPLFADDPLLKGYWEANMGVADTWPGTIEACLEGSVAGFVGVTPEFDDDIDRLEALLRELRTALRSDRLSCLTLLFRDGIRAAVRRSDSYRIWRRSSALLEAAAE